MLDTQFCKTALLALRDRAENAANDFPPLWHMLVLPEGESLRVPAQPGLHALGSFPSEPTGPKCTFGASRLIGPLPPTVCWPQDLEPLCAVVAEQEFSPFRPLAQKPYRIHLLFGHGEGQTAFESLTADIVYLSTDINRALALTLGGVFYHANDSLHTEEAAILDSWLCTIHWWAWKATDSPLHTSPKVVFGGTGIESHRMDEAVGQKLSYSLVTCDVFTASARAIDLFFRFFDIRPNLVYAVDYPESQVTTEKENSDDSAPPPADTEQRDVDFDRKYMVKAVEEARKSVSEDGRVRPKVGVVVVKDGKELATAFRGELDEGEHAEFTVLERKLANETVAGATVYTTLEPCTTRNHPKLPCAERLIERKVRQVVIGILDPNPEIFGKGFQKLRDANIAVVLFYPDLMSQIEEMNREFIRHHKRAAEPASSESDPHAAPAGSETRILPQAVARGNKGDDTPQGMITPPTPGEYEDGTNVPRGTPFFVEVSRTRDWYRPDESKSLSGWKERWARLRERFEQVVDELRPMVCLLIEQRIPAYPEPAGSWQDALAGRELLQGGGGLGREPSQLFTRDRQPLFGVFPVRDINGTPISNSAGEPFGFRFGLSRMFIVYSDRNDHEESRALPEARFGELARDGTGLLYRLPPNVATSLWRNWPSGFSREQHSTEFLWLDTLFELSWQRKPGDVLHTRREAWLENTSIKLEGQGLFPRLPDMSHFPGSISIPADNGYPVAWRCTIPDVARASVIAIDELLERASAVQGQE